MAAFCLYRQQRADGGVRTGLDIDGHDEWDEFTPGEPAEAPDPALLWYVDLRGEGAGIPADRYGLRDWLLTHADRIEQALDTVAEDIAAGIDHDILPLTRPVPGTPPDVKLEIVVSSLRRVPARQVSDVLRDIRRSLRQFLTAELLRNG